MVTKPTLYQRIHESRAEAKRLQLQVVLSAVTAFAREHGLEVRVFGSYAKGKVREGSDLDILVMNLPAGEKRFALASDIAGIGEAQDISIDVAWADLSPHLVKESIPCA